MDDECSPWQDDPTSISHSEWSKLSSDFTNAGYREGITAGKESAVQQGFDQGFEVGAPLGREIGLLRGICSAHIAFLTSSAADIPELSGLLKEAREIAKQLADLRFSDIAPPDLEAERHALEHLDDSEMDVEMDEELQDKRKMERLEDLIAGMSTGGVVSNVVKRPTLADVKFLRDQLEALNARLGLSLQWS